MPARRPRHPLAALLLALVSTIVLAQSDGAFEAQPLAGVNRVELTVTGVPDDFARYGLTAHELRERISAALTGHGLEVVDAASAARDPRAARLHLRFDANRNPYAFYHYGISLRLLRKLPLDAAAAGYVATEVWSAGRHGVIEPADMKPIYGFADELVARFLAEHGRDNAAAATALRARNT
ncbi:MAG: hypothetical protein RLW61_08405 [Gammaproteobacteria bacterium]